MLLDVSCRVRPRPAEGMRVLLVLLMFAHECQQCEMLCRIFLENVANLMAKICIQVDCIAHGNMPSTCEMARRLEQLSYAGQAF